MNTFSAMECLRFGWETFKSRPWFFVGVTVILLILQTIISSVSSLSEKSGDPHGLAQVALGVIITAIGMVIEIAAIRFALKAHEAPHEVSLHDALPIAPFWKFVGGQIAVGAAVLVGLVLLVVPGVIAAIAFSQAQFLIIDRRLWPIEAMKESWRITKGHWMQLLGLIVLLMLINIAGAIVLMVGLLVSIPVSYLAMVRAYRMLEHSASEMVPAAPAPAL